MYRNKVKRSLKFHKTMLKITCSQKKNSKWKLQPTDNVPEDQFS